MASTDAQEELKEMKVPVEAEELKEVKVPVEADSHDNKDAKKEEGVETPDHDQVSKIQP